MSWPVSDTLKSLSEIWPEPLIIDLLSEHYEIADHRARIAVARTHASILRTLLDDASCSAETLRRDLLTFCAAFGIDAGQIAAGERAVFLELARLVVTRFRRSDRQRDALALGLHVGVSRLAVMSLDRAGRGEARAARALAA